MIYDAANMNEMSMQDIKRNFNIEILLTNKIIEATGIDSNKIHLRPKYLQKIGEDLTALSDMIENSNLTATKKIELQSEIRKLEISMAMLYKKIYTGYVFLVLGVLLMIFGCLRWKKREQDFRNKILEYDFEDKKSKVKREG